MSEVIQNLNLSGIQNTCLALSIPELLTFYLGEHMSSRGRTFSSNNHKLKPKHGSHASSCAAQRGLALLPTN
jgi:hypothetical protein